MNAILYSEGSVVVKDAVSICKLEKFGFGARRLYPMIVLPDSKSTFACQTQTAALTDTSEENDAEPGPSLSPLLLLDEEAFFLLHKGHLSITKGYGQEEVVSAEELWSLFVLKDRNFPLKYKVYEYYKDRSYVMRTGLNFGVDYCAYQALPSECHSEMCITVVDALKVRANEIVTADHDSHIGGDSMGDGASARNHQATQACRMDELGWRHVTTLTRLIPDVMKLCILCYVLPAEWDAASLPPIAVTGTDSAMVTDTTNNGAGTAGMPYMCAEKSETHTTPVKTTETTTEAVVSPYLDLLFSNNAPIPTTTNSASANYCNNATNLGFDSSTPHCLEHLTVRPVTVLVRRLPAPCDTYQTINMIQAQYQAASTAQKKRELKAHKKKQHKQTPKQGNNGQSGPSKQSKQTCSKAMTAQEGSESYVSHPTEEKLRVVTEMDATSALEMTMTTSTGDGDQKLSARQKRVAKHLAQSQAQESKQIKKTRRDHTENRSKVMSNKNKSLLNMMNASEFFDISCGGIGAGGEGKEEIVGAGTTPTPAMVMDVVESSNDSTGDAER